jgi:hypothetical protein
MRRNFPDGGGDVPDFNKIVVGGTEVSAKAKGWRGIGWLRKLPFTSGARVKWCITARPTGLESKGTKILLGWILAVTEGGPTIDRYVSQTEVVIDRPKIWTTNTLWLGEARRQGLRVTLQVTSADGKVETARNWLVGFDTMSSDAFFWWAAALIIGSLGSFGGAIVGGSVVQGLNKGQDQTPIHVYVVTPTPEPTPIPSPMPTATPTPALPAGTDSNAPSPSSVGGQ